MPVAVMDAAARVWALAPGGGGGAANAVPDNTRAAYA